MSDSKALLNYVVQAIKKGKLSEEEKNTLKNVLEGKEAKPAWSAAVVSKSTDFLRKEFKRKEPLLCVSESGEGAVFHPSLGEVHAFRGVGKSNYLVGLLSALANGGDFLAFSPPRKFKVLYVDGELMGEDVQDLIGLVGHACEDFAIITGEEQGDGIPSLATEVGQRWLEDAVVVGGFEVVVLDSWATLGRVPTNDEENWQSFQCWLVRMRSPQGPAWTQDWLPEPRKPFVTAWTRVLVASED